MSRIKFELGRLSLTVIVLMYAIVRCISLMVRVPYSTACAYISTVRILWSGKDMESLAIEFRNQIEKIHRGSFPEVGDTIRLSDTVEGTIATPVQVLTSDIILVYIEPMALPLVYFCSEAGRKRLPDNFEPIHTELGECLCGVNSPIVHVGLRESLSRMATSEGIVLAERRIDAQDLSDITEQALESAGGNDLAMSPQSIAEEVARYIVSKAGIPTGGE